MSEKVVVHCRICGRLMNVPKVTWMVFDWDPSVCSECRELGAGKGDWEPWEEKSNIGRRP